MAESTLRPGDEGYKISWQSNLLTIITLEFSLSNVGNREDIVTRAPFMIVASIVGTNLHLGLKRNMQYSFLQKCNTLSVYEKICLELLMLCICTYI